MVLYTRLNAKSHHEKESYLVGLLDIYNYHRELLKYTPSGFSHHGGLEPPSREGFFGRAARVMGSGTWPRAGPC
jgi:hypothetical protein